MGEKVNMLNEVLGDGMEEQEAIEVKSNALKEEDDALDGVIEDGSYDND